MSKDANSFENLYINKVSIYHVFILNSYDRLHGTLQRSINNDDDFRVFTCSYLIENGNQLDEVYMEQTRSSQ